MGKDVFLGSHVVWDKESLENDIPEQVETSPCKSAFYVGSSTPVGNTPPSSRHFIDVNLHAPAISGGSLFPRARTVVVDGTKGDPHSPSFLPSGTTESSIAVAGVPVVVCAAVLK